MADRTKRKTWAENKQIKQAIRKDRRFYDSSRKPAAERPPRRQGDRQRPRSERLGPKALQRVSRCHACGKKGHWKDECPNRQRPGGAVAGFAFMPEDAEDTATGMLVITASSVREAVQLARQPGPPSWLGSTFLGIDLGCALVDSGAGQDLIGLRTYEQEVELLAS
eukprot:7326297-Alexandrium_andersonii.AAC.1